MKTSWEDVAIDRYINNEEANVYRVRADADVTKVYKATLVAQCSKCGKTLRHYDKTQSYGCKHCGQMFNSSQPS